ncbi:hypothetical protein NDU88_006819 [Pleurodeles waltl]|uniref:Uncharacterized protein n=1 Tax=Pleurodeles waltl TaxID=8319 RepID=A0AAV7N447_PLEWA|nr:hypothetical protein NDU88_006819 [Pleurodeles waltl]
MESSQRQHFLRFQSVRVSQLLTDTGLGWLLCSRGSTTLKKLEQSHAARLRVLIYLELSLELLCDHLPSTSSWYREWGDYCCGRSTGGFSLGSYPRQNQRTRHGKEKM